MVLMLKMLLWFIYLCWKYCASSILKGMKKIKLIVITARTDEPISPCGMCRQVIREFYEMLVVLTSGNTDSIWHIQ